MMQLVGAIITLIGSIFLFLGALGVFRMPDVFNRIQAGTKATTLGTMLFLIGITIGHTDVVPTLKIIILILFILFTNPLSSHALARAAHYIKTPLAEETVRDDLAKDEDRKEP
ncbi:MAG: monovalent cation/H(+) antiporter subunit G [Candidatus Cloacimonetes bacterium]|nr:monovalent cation/H(+) antiporter subunit G [Candidatus Cloacimonadota bacterium]MBS3767648.1 monovalent cation/H(+) antiporter subunit G [Candidatus Cloacimonadota bacterium]